MRPILLTKSKIDLGIGVFVRNGARIEGVKTYLTKQYFPEILISDGTIIEQNLHLTCANSIYIGKNTSIASNVTITDINHPYTNPNIPPDGQEIEVSYVIIGQDCKIYNNVVILPGVSIGNHCVIGANSVVNRSIPDYCVAVGAPAKIIKRYNFTTSQWQRTDATGEFT